MGKGRISYDPGQHEALRSELDRVQSNFESLIDVLEKVRDMVESELKGEAASSLEFAISDLINKLSQENSNWSIVIGNAKAVEEELKEADKQAAKVSASP
ncbi:peptidase [Streptococcus sp. A22]|uniref:peptidase n=1 Tax=Streptococcus sp. A22 TaxID=3373126 RepID=UPI0029902F87|nr:peptidase [Streptococcus suis]